MKKLLALMFTIALVFSMTYSVAYADAPTVDLSTFSLEELFTLYESVRGELIKREGFEDNDLIGRGTYVVGTDIRAGTYKLVVAESFMSGDTAMNNIFVTETNNNGDIIYVSSNNFIPIGESLVLSIAEGQTLIIKECACYITPYTPSWAP